MRQSGKYRSRRGDRLRRTARISVAPAKVIVRYLDFLLAYLVALVKEVSEGYHWKTGSGIFLPYPGTFDVLFAMLAIDA